MLLCTVRDCRRPLRRDGQQLLCGRGHAFDIARSGYINLIQPQDRKSLQAGDSAEAIDARDRFHAAGFTQPFLAAIRTELEPQPGQQVLDVGCGGGFYIATLASQSGCAGHGIDLSKAAIETAARRYSGCEWVIANADRFVPYQTKSMHALFSITARMNPPEFYRVLRSDGRLVVAIPAKDDLIELRGEGRDRTARTREDFAPFFHLVHQHRVTTTALLEPQYVNDVLRFIYRPRHRLPEQAIHVTLSLDFLRFEPRNRIPV